MLPMAFAQANIVICVLLPDDPRIPFSILLELIKSFFSNVCFNNVK